MTTLTAPIGDTLETDVGSRIVVGYDGSASSVSAATWAAEEAVARDAPLSILSCAVMPVGIGWAAGAAAVVEDGWTFVERAATEQAEALAVQIRRAHPTLRGSIDVRVGAPREVLVDASHDAALLVVGKTGAGAVKTLILGSVANSVVRRSACPSVLVPAGAVHRRHAGDGVSRGRIAVGVDGSPQSDAAIAWALDEAAARKSEVVLVQAWSFSYPGPVVESGAAHDAAAKEASRILDAAVAAASSRRPEVPVSGRLVEDSASHALLDQAESADLLVVGSRGRGGLRSMLFGSVASAVTEHASCPTVVVHSTAH